MANTDIYVGTKGTITATAYPVGKGDHITFHNKGPATLTVTFTDMPLCDKNNKNAVNPVVVPAGMQSESLKVCKGPKDGNYPFTNQIEGFAAEDPIVIIEQSSNPIVIIEYAPIVGALLIGLAVGYWIAKRRGNRTIARN